MKPKLKFQIATVSDMRLIAYVISVNDGWYTAAHLLTKNQRAALRQHNARSAWLRSKLKTQLEQKFWRFIGGQ